MRGKAKIRDVAREAGVAVGTVSRVLNRHPTVAEPIRRRVQAAIAALAYEPDPIAGSLRRGTTGLVACAVRDFDLPRFALFIKEAERVLRERGFTLLLSTTGNAPEVELSLLRAFAARRVDGVMMTVSDEAHAGVRAALAASPIPVLLIDREAIDTQDRVAADHRSGAEAATGHLLDLGHRRIALLTGDPRAHPARSRIEGFRDAHAARGLSPDPALIAARVLTAEDAFRETMTLFGQPARPTALFVAAMDMLAGTLRALRALNLRVGEDVSLIDGSDSDLAELHAPPITALRWDLAEMGRHGAAMLLDRMQAGVLPAPRVVRVPATLILRGSCRPAQKRNGAAAAAPS